MTSPDSKKDESVEKDSFGHVVKKNEEIKEVVEEAATKITSVNEELTKEEVPAKVIKQSLEQNQDAEKKVKKAAADLKLVNTKLAKELADRIVIESELADTKANLAEVHNDLLQSQAKEEEAQKSAFLDALTGLPNRVLFDQGLEHGLIQAKRQGWGLAILFIDIDKFKTINDTYGHDTGDQVLLMVAKRLQAYIRGDDRVSRWGGDEFVCLLLEIKQEEDVARLAEEMIARIAEPFEFNEHVFHIKASIGIAIYPKDGETAKTLFKNADTAMYNAKTTKQRFVVFRESLNKMVF